MPSFYIISFDVFYVIAWCIPELFFKALSEISYTVESYHISYFGAQVLFDNRGYFLNELIVYLIQRVYHNASNLISFDNVCKFQIDPEIEARVAVVYPQQRTILVGFNITF